MSRLLLVVSAASRRRLAVPSGAHIYLDAANSASYPGSGTTWTDLSGNGNHASMLSGFTWNAGGWMELDGITGGNGYASITDKASNRPTTAWSMAIWCRPENLNAVDARFLLTKRTDANTAASFNSFIWSNDALNVDVPNFNSRWASNIGMCVNNTWQHLAVTWSGASREVRFYKNGSLNVARSNAATSIASQTSQVLIGAGGGSTLRFGGRMGVVLFYNNRALTASEVNASFEVHRSRYGV